jgi:hypothetical protein
MANTKEIVKDIREMFGSALINATQAGTYLGWAADKRGAFLSGLEYYQDGKEKKYHAIDIAKRLEQCRFGF